MPSLKERREDIPVISQHILTELAVELGLGKVEMTPAFEKKLQSYHWPGNIRELRNFLERKLFLSDETLLDAEDPARGLEPQTGGSPGSPVSGDKLVDIEKSHMEKVLREEGGHVVRAARRLGIPRSSLYHKIKTLGISSSDL